MLTMGKAAMGGALMLSGALLLHYTLNYMLPCSNGKALFAAFLGMVLLASGNFIAFAKSAK